MTFHTIFVQGKHDFLFQEKLIAELVASVAMSESEFSKYIRYPAQCMGNASSGTAEKHLHNSARVIFFIKKLPLWEFVLLL